MTSRVAEKYSDDLLFHPTEITEGGTSFSQRSTQIHFSSIDSLDEHRNEHKNNLNFAIGYSYL
jgi:hypothetical protein